MKTKIFKTATMLLFIAVVVQTVLIGYNRLQNKDKPVELDFYDFMKVLQIKNYQDSSTLLGIFDLKTYFTQQKNIRVEKDKIKISADKTQWFGYISSPIVLTCPFRILLNFSGQNDYTALVFSGKINTQEKEWWEDISRLYLAYNQKEGFSAIELRDGKSPDSSFFPLEHELNDNSVILEFSDPQGKSLSVYDTKGSLLTQINIAGLKDKYFPFGLFPERKMYTGVLVAPGSRLTINKLLYYQRCTP